LVTDVRKHAAWKHQLIPVEVGILIKPSQHPIWNIPGLTRYHAPGDLMHTGCLGVILWLLGSVLWELLYDCDYFTGTVKSRLEQLWHEIDLAYDALGFTSRISCLTIQMILGATAEDFPCLGVKAAEAKQLLPVVLQV